jgi:GTP 3',8-cyclase
VHLKDGFGRIATDLRVSLTDRCDLRCSYCMPAEGLPWLPQAELLTDDELVRLVRIGVERLGIREVRLTGGEPLIRPGAVGLVGRLAALTPRPQLSLTTNGIALARLAAPLAEAGLDRINVSLDTLDPAVFHRLTRRDRHDRVLAGLAAAAAAGLLPVKVNTVLMRGVNDHEAADLLRWCLGHDYELRFIEQMPLDAQHGWDRSSMVTADEILAALGAAFTLVPQSGRGAAPAETWWAVEREPADGRPTAGPVGVIGAVTRPFCAACDRVRLTADGQIRTCLFAREESDLRSLMRSGADDAALAEAWRIALLGKKAAAGIGEPGFIQPRRPMSAIGG